MTQLTHPLGSGRRAYALLAVLAVMTALLFGATQLSAARAQTGTASVTIVKQGLLGDDTATFSQDFDDSGDFSLSQASNSITFSNLEPGTYSVTEMPLEGYTLTGAGCALTAGRSAAPFAESAGNTLGITVAEGQNLTCTFINGSTQVLQYDVTIVKYVDEALATEGSFDFTATWDADNTSGSGPFALNSGNGFTAVTDPLDAGASYSIVENGIDATCEGEDAYSLAGYTVGSTLEEAAGATPADAAAIADLQSDQYIIVWNETCEPVGTGSITIVKDGLQGDGVADFTSDVPGASDTFQLSASDNSETFTGLPAGTYTFMETASPGYNFVSAGCEFSAPPSLAPQDAAPANSLVVILGDGENQTCTFTNELDTNTVTVQKYIDGAAASGDAVFNLTATTPASENAVTLDSSNAFTATSGPIPFGSSYMLSEDGIDGTCDEGDAYRIAGYSMGATAEEAAAAEVTDTLDIASLEADTYVIVWNQDCANIATITIVKDFDPDSDAEAGFTSDVPGNAEFSISEGDENGMTFANLNSGTYTFTEDDLEGWMLQSIFCSGQSSPSNILINLGGATLGVTVNAGDNITCTFTNIDDGTGPEPGTGSITLTKNWTGEALGPDATFALSDNLGDDDDLVTLVDDGVGNSVTYSDLPAGTYSFDEAVLEGWGVTAIQCTGIVPESFAVDLTAGTLSIDLADGAIATCSFTNTAAPTTEGGSLTIVKSWVGGDAEATSFTVSGSLGGDAGAFTLDASDNSEVFDTLEADDYAVMESPLDGWTLTGIDCAGATDSTFTGTVETGELAVVLADEEDLVCTFTNSADDTTPEGPSLTIAKIWEGGDAATTSFTTSENLGAEGNTFDLDGETPDMAFDGLENDTNYVVTETIPGGWDVSNIACTGQTDSLFDTDFETGVLSITLASDEDVTCTYTNTAEGTTPGAPSLTIVKAWENGDPIATTFTASENLGAEGNTFDLDGTDTEITFDDLVNGANYVVTETIAEGWDVSSIVCTGQTESLFDTDFETGVLSVTLEADEDLVCTYTNIVEGTEPPPPTGTGSLTIVKAWDGGGAGSATFSASDNLGDDDNSFVLDGTATQVQFNDLADGNYVVDEADAAGWAVSSIVCTGGTNSLWDTDFPTGVLSVNLVDDEDLTCTFTNMAVTTPPTGGSLTINKAWVGGAAAPTTFTTSANLGDSDNSVVLDGTTASVVFPNLANGGMYVVTESTPAGWSITDITCTGATDSDVDDVSAADAVAVTLANNENVVCTFTNTAIEGTENPVQNVPDVNDVDSSTPDNGVGTDVPSFNLPSTNVPPANVPSGNVPQSNDSNAVSNAPAPSSNIPSIELPSSVSNQAPSGPVSNVAGQQAPLPPSAGNAQGSASNTPIALFASLAVMVGALAAASYGLRRR